MTMPSINSTTPATGTAWRIDLTPESAESAPEAVIAPDALALGSGAAAASIAPISSRVSPGKLSSFLESLWSTRLFQYLASQQPAAPKPVPAPAPSGPLPKANIAQAVDGTPSGQPLALGAAVYEFNGFDSRFAHVTGNETEKNALDLPARFTGVAGAGIDRTIIRMAPHTSTDAKNIPTAPMTTNQYSLMRVTGDGVNLHDFTLQATDQGHLYNGLRVHISKNPRITNMKVTGVPGASSSPPGETFGIDDYRTQNSVYKHIEVDGAGVGASGFGANNSTNVTIEHGLFHNNPHGIGATFWQTKDVTLIDCTTKDNHNGFNFERVSGTVNLIRPVFGAISGTHDISIGTDQSNAVYNIVDPVLPPGQKLRILVGKNYLGKPSPQTRANVHVIVNGVDRTNELVHWE
jgi:hypothetical protein